jgi:uncharacterized protein (TIGR02145 family)
MQKQLLGLLLLGTLAFSSCKKDAATFQNDFTNEVLSGKPGSGGGGLTDADGNVYDTVRIGNQTWTKQNWRCSKLNDGTPLVKLSNSATATYTTDAAYTFANDDSATTNATYGNYYNPNAVLSGKLAPQGWHVSTEADWLDLLTAVGQPCLDPYQCGNGLAAPPLRATKAWPRGTKCSNKSGFTALPSGQVYNGNSYVVLADARFWSSTPGEDPYNPGFKILYFFRIYTGPFNDVYESWSHTEDSPLFTSTYLPVRLVKD